MRRPPRTDVMVQFFQSVRWSSSFATLHRFPHVNPAPFGAKFWQLHTLDRVTQRNEMRTLGASPDVLVGSVHAITEQGEIMIASATGYRLVMAACHHPSA